MTQHQQKLLDMYFSGMSYEEIANVMDTKIATTRAQIKMARRVKLMHAKYAHVVGTGGKRGN